MNAKLPGKKNLELVYAQIKCKSDGVRPLKNNGAVRRQTVS